MPQVSPAAIHSTCTCRHCMLPTIAHALLCYCYLHCFVLFASGHYFVSLLCEPAIQSTPDSLLLILSWVWSSANHCLEHYFAKWNYFLFLINQFSPPQIIIKVGNNQTELLTKKNMTSKIWQTLIWAILVSKKAIPTVKSFFFLMKSAFDNIFFDQLDAPFFVECVQYCAKKFYFNLY